MSVVTSGGMIRRRTSSAVMCSNPVLSEYEHNSTRPIPIHLRGRQEAQKRPARPWHRAIRGGGTRLRVLDARAYSILGQAINRFVVPSS